MLDMIQVTRDLSRRDFISALLSGAAGLSFSSSSLFARSEPSSQQGPAPVVATKLTNSIAVLAGDGGNVGLLIGADGLMMIDAGLANRASDLLKAIAEVDSRPVMIL